MRLCGILVLFLLTAVSSTAAFAVQMGSLQQFLRQREEENVLQHSSMIRESCSKLCYQKRCAYGYVRHPRTTQERRWTHAWDDEQDEHILCRVRVRSSRSDRHLPDEWDDICSHNDKSWKTQSKRRHQWKEIKMNSALLFGDQVVR